MYTDDRVGRFIQDNFIPVKLHVKDQAADYQKFAQRFDAQWTPTILELDSSANVRHKIEGFLPADDFLAQLILGLGHTAFKADDWKRAEELFRRIVNELPDTEAAPEALYWAGVAAYKGSNDGKALGDTAAAFKSRYTDSSWAKKASVWGG